MFYPRQIILGLGRKDSGALDRAVAIALELYAAGIWDGRGSLTIHFPYSLYQQLLASPVERFAPEYLADIHADVRRLRPGRDYEIHPLDVQECRRVGISEACALEP